MSLSDVSIKNPVFAVMLSLAMVIFGYLGYRDLGISQFPEIDFPVVSIITYREASDPETMDADVTDIIEDAVSNVEGIDYIQSQSSEGNSIVTVFFRLSRKIDVAMQDVQNVVSAALNRLPPDIDPPIVTKVNFNKFPVIWLSVHGPRPAREIADFVDTQLKQQVETIPGCGGCMYGGMRKRNMRLWLDGKKLQSYSLDALDVMQALRREHVEKPAGQLIGATREINVRVMGEGKTAEHFRQMPVVNRNGQIIRLGDVAIVEDGLEDRRAFARFNREPNIGLGVMRATGANVVEVCDEVKRRLPALRRQLPPGMEISISTDYSLFIKEDIEELKSSLFYGVLLTALVTFVFLGSVGSTLNVCISIPTSLIGTFMAMKLCGFTVNFMTLLALSLSVGVVVDDAMVVLENIYRRREHGEAKRQAALVGAREISFAAIAATFSIVAIFIPVAFMEGSIGQFFFQFGITVTVAVLLSLVISLTITPMLCAVFMNVRQMRRPCPGRFGGLLGRVWTPLVRLHWVIDRWLLEPLLVAPVNWLMDRCSRWYAVILRHTMRRQWFVVPASALLAASALFFAFGIPPIPLPEWASSAIGSPGLIVKPGIARDRGKAIMRSHKPLLEIGGIGKELVPSEDQNRFICNVICPVGCSIDYVDQRLREGEDVLIHLRDPVTHKEVVAGCFAAVSIRPGQLISEGILFVRLIPADERSWSQTDIINQVRVAFARGMTDPESGQKSGPVIGARTIVLDLSTQGFTATRGYPIDFAVQGPDWPTVTKLSERIRERMTDSGVVTDVNSDYRPGMPEVRIRPDKVKAAELNVPVQRIANVLNVAVGGMRNGRFTDIDKRYDVRVRYLEAQRSSPDHTEDVYVRGEQGKLVPLSDLVVRETVPTLPIINRYNHLRKVEITANMAPDVSQGEAIARAHEIAEEVREEMDLPPSYRIIQLGNAQAMRTTLNSMWWALALGFVVAYMILGVQFNSFVHPFTVLMAVPFGVTGALGTLWITGDTLNLMSMIGMVLLAGLVKKNSIILVDYANQLREQGMGPKEAMLEAGPVRLRPIVMTSLATIAAAVPLALGLGAGAETRAPLARSIIGGIILSTLVTLVIVPVLYVLFDGFASWVTEQSRRRPKGGKTPLNIERQEYAGKNGHVPVTVETAVTSS